MPLMKRTYTTPDGKATPQNGFWTISSSRSGEHRTFRIRTLSKDSKFAPGERTIGLLTGPDNTSAYKDFGFVTTDGINVWRRFQKGGQEANGGAYCNGRMSAFEFYARVAWGLLVENDASPFRAAGYSVEGHGTCVKCGRMLTTPESIELGIGPVCASKS